MKLHLTIAENHCLITGYGAGDDGNFVEINKQRHTRNLIVMADKLILDWQATDFASLAEAHFAQIVALKPEVVLLGTGEKHQFFASENYSKAYCTRHSAWMHDHRRSLQNL